MADVRRVAGDEPAVDTGVLVTQSCRVLKEELGPTAWAVLEDVVLDAVPVGWHWEARTSVRLIAAHLGVTPGTVARALARLCEKGAVRREDRRDVVTGRFGESVYVIEPLPGVVPCVASRHTVERDTAVPGGSGPTAGKPNAEEGDGVPPGPVDAPASSSPSLARTNQSTSSPETPNHQSPTTNQPNHQTNDSTPTTNPTTQRATNTCQPSGQAWSGRASC